MIVEPCKQNTAWIFETGTEGNSGTGSGRLNSPMLA